MDPAAGTGNAHTLVCSEPGMLAVVDESTAVHPSGLTYVVAAVVVISNPGVVREMLERSVLQGNRKRPFHWSKEGPKVRGLVCDIATGNCFGSTFASSCGRKGQEAARERILRRAFQQFEKDGIEHVIVESRDRRQDIRDRRVLKQYQQEHGEVGFALEFAPKTEPLLWLADSLASGTREELEMSGSDPESLRIMRAMGSIEPLWVPH